MPTDRIEKFIENKILSRRRTKIGNITNNRTALVNLGFQKYDERVYQPLDNEVSSSDNNPVHEYHRPSLNRNMISNLLTGLYNYPLVIEESIDQCSKSKIPKKIEIQIPEEYEDEPDDEKNDPCCICMERGKNTVILDCGHVQLCVTCSRELVKFKKECPFCRKKIEKGIMRIY